MSYQSTTPNFDLPQWVYSDPPQMNDFNTAFANIDEKAIPNDEKGAANGVATLNSSGKLAQMPSASDVGAVPTTRTVNGKALSSNISLTASDVGAVPNGGNVTINNRLQLTGTQYPQIYGNGILQLGGDSRNVYGVVLRSNGTDEANAFRPSVNAGTTGHLYLGVANQKWRAVFAQNGTIQTSDRNAKHDITDLDPEKITAFIMGLKPSSYVFNDADSGRTHWGLISQDIEELFPQLGMTSMDFAGFIKSPKTEDYYEDVPETVTDEETGEEKTVIRKELKTRTVEGEYIYSLRYDEFIAPLICMVQKQQKQIENLERRLSALENKEEAK